LIGRAVLERAFQDGVDFLTRYPFRERGLRMETRAISAVIDLSYGQHHAFTERGRKRLAPENGSDPFAVLENEAQILHELPQASVGPFLESVNT
jgi:hypothetical protein